MRKNKKNKTVCLKQPKSKKEVKISSISVQREYPIFLFDRIDKGAQTAFAFDTAKGEFKHKEFVDKIINYSKMTWREVEQETHDDGRSKHHFLADLHKISHDALKRLEAMQLDDMTESLYSMSFNNKLRIIGLRDGDYFHILWYDQEHKVCPVRKRHT